MALKNFIMNGVQEQINFIQGITRAIVKPPAENVVGQVVSLLNVLGAASRKQVVKRSINNFKPIAIPISQLEPPIESVKGIGKKLGVKLRLHGISSTEDLKRYKPGAFKIPGISASRIQKWQNSL